MRREEMARKEEIFNNPMIMKKLYDDLVSNNPMSKPKKKKKDRKEKSSSRKDKKKRSSSGKNSKRSRSRSRSVEFNSDSGVKIFFFPKIKISRMQSHPGNLRSTKAIVKIQKKKESLRKTKKHPEKKKKSDQKATTPAPTNPKNPLMILKNQKSLIKRINYSTTTLERG